MIVRLAVRTLLAHPVRTAVLAGGFGAGVGVMAVLLGVGQVVLDQARAPELAGGGHVVVRGMASGRVEAARLLLGGALASPAFAGQARAVSPNSRATLYLVRGKGTVPIKARAGVPSQERAIGDPEVRDVAAWRDTPEDRLWTTPDPGNALRAIDAFHPIPNVPARAASWAEWLYFNGRAGEAKFYLTFLVGARLPDGTRPAGVRLQLDRKGRIESFSGGASLTDADLARAPDLTVGDNRVRLSGRRYAIHLDLGAPDGRRVTGDLTLDGDPGRQMPPIEIQGAAGWRSGYVVPVMSGGLAGSLAVGDARLSFDGGSGYHDHNWGFWEGVSWQWGQVQHGALSFVFGRVFPPPDAADADRVPGFLGAIGPDGPLGYATRVTIEETNAAGTSRPERIVVQGRSTTLDLTLSFQVAGVETSRLQGPMANALSFLQMRGAYTVTGTMGDEKLEFTSEGSAETFRGDMPGVGLSTPPGANR